MGCLPPKCGRGRREQSLTHDFVLHGDHAWFLLIDDVVAMGTKVDVRYKPLYLVEACRGNLVQLHGGYGGSW